MTDTFRRAVIPAANLHANARGLDQLYCVLAGAGSAAGLDLAPASVVEDFGACHVRGASDLQPLLRIPC